MTLKIEKRAPIEQPSAASVAVLSTGAMGSAFVRRFLEQGVRVTVWNRTLSRADPLVERGATAATSIEDAIASSELIIAVPHPYRALFDYLVNDAAGAELSGKDLVVMSSCESRAEPERLLEWSRRHGAHFIDGKILMYPRDIGRPTASLALCGDPEVFQRVSPVMEILGSTMYVGETITNAFIVEASAVSWYISTVVGFFNGLALSRSAGLPDRYYVDACVASLPGMSRYLRHAVRHMLPDDDYDPDRHGTASIGGLIAVMEHFATVFGDYGIVPGLLNSVKSPMREHVEAGKGGLDLASLLERFVRAKGGAEPDS